MFFNYFISYFTIICILFSKEKQDSIRTLFFDYILFYLNHPCAGRTHGTGLPAGSPVLFTFIMLFAYFLFLYKLPRKLLYPSETVADYGVRDAFQYLIGFEEHKSNDRWEVEDECAQD